MVAAGEERCDVTPRLSRLQKRILRWFAVAHPRTKGFILRSHEALVQALGG